MKNIIGVIRDDMNGLVHRLNFHQEGYIKVFSNERTRQHFDDIFYSRYSTITGSDLALIDPEMLELVSRFYKEVKDLYLYFRMTEDMPSAVANKLSTSLKLINDLHSKFIDFDINDISLSGDASVDDDDNEKKKDTSEALGPETHGHEATTDLSEANGDDSSEAELLESDGENVSSDVEKAFSLDQLDEEDNDSAPPPFTK